MPVRPTHSKTKTTHTTRKSTRPDVSHTGFAIYLEQYNETLRVRNYAESTIDRRDSQLRRFILWCDDIGLDNPTQVTKPLIERYQRHLYRYRQGNGKPLAMTSQLHYLCSVQQWFKWLSQQNHIVANPSADIILPKRNTTLPVVLSIEQVKQLMQQPNTHTANGIRDRAILELFYATGIRRSELINLTLSDINLNQHTLLVRQGKGNKDRLLPIGNTALHWLGRYLNESRDTLTTTTQNTYTATLFLNNQGKPYRDTKLGDRVKAYLIQAGIHCKGACHLLRHAMATHMLDNGAEIRYIQAMLGHSDLSSTQIYTHVAINQLQQIHAKTHPSCQAMKGDTLQ